MKRVIEIILAIGLVGTAITYGQSTVPTTGPTRPTPNSTRTRIPKAAIRKMTKQEAELTEAELLGIKAFTLDTPALEFACDPKSGAVATVHPSEAVIRLYAQLTNSDDLNNQVQTVKIGDQPCAVRYKMLGGKGYFVVLCVKDHSLWLIDSTKPEVRSKIVIAAEQPVLMAVAESAPFVWYTTQNKNVGRVNLETRKDEGLAQVESGVLPEEFSDIAVSVDGRVIYNRHLFSSPTGIQAWRVGNTVENKLTLTPIMRIHASTDSFVPDPWGQKVGTGNIMWDTELINGKLLEERNDNRGQQIVGFLAGKPVFFTFDYSRFLRAYSFNTQQLLQTITIPNWSEEWVKIPEGGYKMVKQFLTLTSTNNQFGDGPMRWPYRLFLGSDEKHGNLVLGMNDRIVIIPESVLKLPEEPLLVAKVDGRTTATVGETVTLQLGKLDDRATVTLNAGTTDLSIVGDKLIWKPTEAGNFSVDLLLSGAGIERHQKLSLTARRNFVDLGFVPSRWYLAAGGKFAVAYATGNSDNPGMASNKIGTRLVLVNLQKGVIAARRDLTFNISSAVMDEQNVYVGLADSDAIIVLNRQDLSDVRRIFTKLHIETLDLVGKNLMVQGIATNANGSVRQLVRYKLPELSTVDQPVLPLVSFSNESDQACNIGINWFEKGILWDSTLIRPLLLIQPQGFIMVKPDLKTWHDPREKPQIGQWGVQLNNSTLFRGPQRVGQFEANGSCILTTIPALVTLVETPVPTPESTGGSRGIIDQGRPMVKHRVVVRDLFTATTVSTITLAEEPQGFRSTDIRFRQAERVQERDGNIILQQESRLYVLSTDDLGASQLKAPLHWNFSQSTLGISSKDPTEVTLSASGGTGPLVYGFTEEVPWAAIDKNTGKLTITPASAVAKGLMLLSQQHISMGVGTQTDTQPVTPQVLLNRYQNLASPFYRVITGQAPKGIPVAVMVGLVVTDSEQLNVNQKVCFLMDVPLDVALAGLEKINYDIKKQQQNTRVIAAQQNSGEAHAVENVNLLSLQNRVRELEQRNLELEGQIKLLKEILSSKRSEATTKP